MSSGNAPFTAWTGKRYEDESTFPLLIVVMVTGCRANEVRTPEATGEMPYGEVDFAFFTPGVLPAVVTKALIIDNEKVVSAYRTLDSTQENPDSVGSWSSRVSRHAQFNKARHPPGQILFCWDSVIDKKTYETRITFSPALREKMSEPTGKVWCGNTAWYDTLLFGLAPEGKVRIWLQNSAPLDSLPVEPVKITTLSGLNWLPVKGLRNTLMDMFITVKHQNLSKGKISPRQLVVWW